MVGAPQVELKTSMGACMAVSLSAEPLDCLTTDLKHVAINASGAVLGLRMSGSCAGDITVELYDNHAPRTCENFIGLARRRYYDRTKVHRIVRDFMVQAGDPTGTGKGGESIWGGKFEDEINPDLKHVGAGVLSMANAGPNTNGSQFFITLAPTPWLDGKHTIFGRVYSGMDTVKRLGNVQTNATDRPFPTDVTILSARPL